MTKPMILLASLCFCTQQTNAQMPPTCLLIDAGFFTSSWGGVTETTDGGAAFCGGYDPTNAGYSDVVVTKLDVTGALQWIKTYSTGSVPSEWGRDIIATSGGGLTIAGYLDLGVVFIMELDANGEQQWTKTYSAPAGVYLQMGTGFTQLPDGGYALTCTASSASNDAWLMLRTDANGEVLWSDRLDYTGGYPLDVAALPNGDLVFTGQVGGLGEPSLILRKDGLTGTTEWMHWYTAGPDHVLAMYGLVTTADSTIVVAGYDAAFYGADAFALALSPEGTPLWSTRFGTDEIEEAENIAIAPNGDYLLAGRRLQDTTNLPPMGRFVVRIDPNGQLVWSKNVGHPDATNNWPVRCAAASDGGVLVTGYAGTMTNYPQSFIKLDANGNSCPYCPSTDAGVQNTLVIAQAADQGSAVLGPWATAADLTFTVTDLTPDVEAEYCGTTGLEERTIAAQVSITPNPFIEHTTFTVTGAASMCNAMLELRDVLGRVVLVQNLENCTSIISRNGLASGHYIYRVISTNGTSAHGALQVTDR